jgi:hypothetical protein
MKYRLAPVCEGGAVCVKLQPVELLLVFQLMLVEDQGLPQRGLEVLGQRLEAYLQVRLSDDAQAEGYLRMRRIFVIMWF